jgi:hypothetical protein
MGNVIPGVIFTPANVIKVRYMESTQKRTLINIISTTLKNEGIHAFFKGIGATILRDSIWGVIYFPLYNHIKNSFTKTDDTSTTSKPDSKAEFWHALVASTTAASAATFMSSFFDGVRLLQQRTASHKEAPGTSILKSQIQSFFKGLKKVTKPTGRNAKATFTGVARVVVSTVTGQMTFVQVNKLLEQKNTTATSKG